MENNKPDYRGIGLTILAILSIIVLVICMAIKIWVVCEYGDKPITEVPSWTIVWLDNQ